MHIRLLSWNSPYGKERFCAGSESPCWILCGCPWRKNSIKFYLWFVDVLIVRLNSVLSIVNTWSLHCCDRDRGVNDCKFSAFPDKNLCRENETLNLFCEIIFEFILTIFVFVCWYCFEIRTERREKHGETRPLFSMGKGRTPSRLNCDACDCPFIFF